MVTFIWNRESSFSRAKGQKELQCQGKKISPALETGNKHNITRVIIYMQSRAYMTVALKPGRLEQQKIRFNRFAWKANIADRISRAFCTRVRGLLKSIFACVISCVYLSLPSASLRRSIEIDCFSKMSGLRSGFLLFIRMSFPFPRKTLGKRVCRSAVFDIAEQKKRSYMQPL